ncbi:hypothetical protein MUP79_05120, partial [Candidatus Bathyarchaeota archaeon]|nr:hypothetical protein [Candidatus Bathyarchaeota archaeon]
MYSVVGPTPARATPTTGFEITNLNLLPSAGPAATWVTVTGTLNATILSTTCTFSASSPYFFSDSASDRFCTASGNSFFGSFRVRPPEQISTSKPLPGLTYVISITVTAPTGYAFNSTGNTTSFKVTPRVGFSTSSSASQPWPSYVVAMMTDTVYVHGWGYNATTLNCQFLDNSTLSVFNTTLAVSQLCSVNAGELTGQFTLNGTTTKFYGKTLVIRAKGIPLNEWATGTMIITHPVTKAVLTPSHGPPNTLVTVSGSGWNALDHHVTMNLTTAGLWISNANLTCTASAGSITGTCQFTVKPNAKGGPHSIVVVGSELDSALVDFVVEATFVITPISGPRFTNVTFSGVGYKTTGTCAGVLGSLPVGLISPSPAVQCSIDGDYLLKGSFRVSNTSLAGIYTVTFGNTTIAAQGQISDKTFTVNIPVITLSSYSGTKGSAITVTGLNFNAGDTACQLYYGIGFVPTSWIPTGSCAVTGVGSISGSFTVPTLAPGNLVIKATGTPRNDNATASFALKPTISLAPAAGRPGTSVLVSGTNFAGNDTSCAITSSPSGLITNPICTVAGGAMAGSFIVASGTNGSYTVTVTGTTGDAGSASFNVPPPPTLALTPSSGPVGTFVSVSGSNYVGTTCLLSAVPSGLFTSQSCSIAAGTLTGSFAVSSSAPTGSYTITVQTNAGAGDSATSVFTVGLTTTTTGTTSVQTTTVTSGSTMTVTSPATTTSVTVATTFSTTTAPWIPPRPCIIATVTFGSEVSSAVQFLRNFRDGLVLSTKAGSAFMEVFNAWYYSFSPSVAGFIAGNDPLRAPVRVLLYPLLGILGVSSLAYSLLSGVPEFAIVVAGLAASSLIGLVYLTLPAMFGVRAFLKRRRVRLVGVAKGSVALLTIALALLAVGEVTGSFLLLAIGGSATV